jgi:hypothetical protein
MQPPENAEHESERFESRKVERRNLETKDK